MSKMSVHKTLDRSRKSAASRTRAPHARQTELEFRSWGGARNGAGRKPKGERAGVPHVSRPVHKARFPLLVTSRLLPGLRSLRHAREAQCIRRALDRANRATLAKAPDEPPFQVVHHSIQTNHLHLIVEASDRASLTAGMRGLLVRIARALNRLWGRRGAVFADRFHERGLRSPREVRNALVYVLQNLRKHGIALAGPDPLSSGPEFDGWDAPHGRAATEPAARQAIRDRQAVRSVRRSRFGGDWRSPAGGGGCAPVDAAWFQRAARAAAPRAKTWLLGVGWKVHGLIGPGETPRRS
jgi:REP element-mobilizing transposase RayT